LVRLLIVRSCAIGDFVLNLPALGALALAHPDARFTLVGNPATLALARPFLAIEAIHDLDAAPWRELFAGPANLPAFDRAWVWMTDPVVADNLRRSGVPAVHHAPAFPVSGHAADHLLRTVGLPQPPLPDLWRGDRNGPILLHPGSGSTRKNWPHFAYLATALAQAVVLRGPADAAIEAPNPRLEELPLAAVAEQVSNCRVFVGNDSGITHLAAYWGAPTIALFGPTDTEIWGPRGRRVTVLSKPALADITVSDVLQLL
jgi:ADP-heptose:LPS heptosyltransferase